MTFAAFHNDQVAAHFAALPEPVQTPLLALRQTILDTAAANPAIGRLCETLKWNEPAYLPERPRTGTTIRINAVGTGRYAMFVHCQTSLIDQYGALYPGMFRFEGSRAVLFDAGSAVPQDPLRHIITLALTYHLRG